MTTRTRLHDARLRRARPTPVCACNQLIESFVGKEWGIYLTNLIIAVVLQRLPVELEEAFLPGSFVLQTAIWNGQNTVKSDAFPSGENPILCVWLGKASGKFGFSRGDGCSKKTDCNFKAADAETETWFAKHNVVESLFVATINWGLRRV